jgi:preprotein translocase subunit SecG
MGMYVVVAVLIILTCVLLTLIVLVQSSKGGGLASNFSSSNQFMGVRKTADFLEKSTWTFQEVPKFRPVILILKSYIRNYLTPNQ